MSNLLYIDTTNKMSSLLMMNDQGVLASRINESLANHGQIINTHIEELLNETSISFDQLDGICVLNGPGSYTGLRISLATAKGICYIKEIPLILINKLDLLHRSAFRIINNAPICTIIKAREDEFFAAFYPPHEKKYTSCKLISKVELIEHLNLHQSTLCLEDYEIGHEFEQFTLVEMTNLDIRNLCFEYFRMKDFADLSHSEPFYLKNVHINKINKL